MSIVYLSVENVLFLHDRIVRRFGGVHGILEFGLLASAVARPMAGFGDYEAYPTLEMKAAVLCHSLLKNHPFREANKRTSVSAMVLMLKENGYRLKSTRREIVQLALDIESDSINEKDIALWILKRMRKIEGFTP